MFVIGVSFRKKYVGAVTSIGTYLHVLNTDKKNYYTLKILCTGTYYEKKYYL